ncbi:MAG: hypothetical protein R3E97_12300 [Candidatus Eisenbacteria bacterium]
MDHRAAVGRHRRFVCEVLAELSGHRHRLETEGPGEAVPTLFVSVHRGNWIVGARALGDPFRPLHTVAGTQLHRVVSPWLVRWLGRQGVVVHPGRGAHRALASVLRSGGRALLHLDGDPFGGESRARARKERGSGLPLPPPRPEALPVGKWPAGVRARPFSPPQTPRGGNTV